MVSSKLMAMKIIFNLIRLRWEAYKKASVKGLCKTDKHLLLLLPPYSTFLANAAAELQQGCELVSPPTGQGVTLTRLSETEAAAQKKKQKGWGLEGTWPQSLLNLPSYALNKFLKM